MDGSIYLALVPFVCLELFNVLVRLLFSLAARFLHDFTQRCIDILGHATRITANEKVGAFRIEPFSNLSGVVQHLMLHVRFGRLNAA
jgi:hypothetical protein